MGRKITGQVLGFSDRPNKADSRTYIESGIFEKGEVG